MSKVFGLSLLLLHIAGSDALRAEEKIKVVATTPDLAWAISEIGKPHVEVRALLSGTENPHYVDALPEFIHAVAQAKIVCMVGFELEVGWMPKVLTRSGNAQVQSGGKGHCVAGSTVTPLEKPAGPVNRSMGDLHPAGNPHYWLSPKVFAQSAVAIVEALKRVDPAHTADYQKGLMEFTRLLQTILDKNKARLESATKATGSPLVMEYHKDFTYFFDAYGLTSLGSIEEKPGVPPSAGRIAEAAISAKSAGVKLALASENSPRKTLERYTEISGINVVTVPTMIQPSGKVKEYAELQARLVDAVVSAMGPGAK